MSRVCADYIEYYRRHFDKWCEDVYDIKLYWWQRVALKMMYRYECVKEAVRRCWIYRL